MDIDLKNIFLTEAHEILANLESDLMLLEKNSDPELLNRIFRFAHTMKGSSAIAGFDEISEFMHKLENVLGSLRSGNIEIDDLLIDLLLGSFDWVKLALSGDVSENTATLKLHLIDQMNAYTDEEEAQLEKPEPAPKQTREWYAKIHARFKDTIFENGIDPLSIMEDLVSLGSVVEMEIDYANFPDLDRLEPERCYIGWDAVLKVKVPREKIEEVFLFVRDDNEITVEDVSGRYIKDYQNEKLNKDRKIGEILVQKRLLTRKELDDVLAMQDIKNRKLGDIIAEKGYATEKEIDSALSEQQQIRTKIETETVRVDTKKLDKLLNLLGEMVIGQSAITRIADELTNEQGLRLKNTIYGLDRTTREFQEQLMTIRMIPIGPLFNQFRRFVRNATKDLGKEIHLEILGEETELDKTVIEKINDPLKHMIRNAIDHGIEYPAERQNKGKNTEGLIRLNAYHQEGNVFIEVSDDGRGLNRDKIRERAISLGLLKPEEDAAEERLFSFLFLPGFTTADEAGHLSGRGVGMDVVKTNIESLRGTIEIKSANDAGTTFLLKLPLTLAIIEGMLIRAGGDIFIIPLLSIVECIQPNPDEVKTVEGKGELMLMRGEYIPLLRLYDLFMINARFNNPWESIVVVVESGGETIGIMVDELVCQQQIVIKSLNGGISSSRAVSGAAILGDGKVALILDIHGLINEMAG